ncbi:hypothetical protein OPQ81_002271 [Rhizoctonia solani]|nr:hypothetical protein OPQ81_002271 [Rhizoctonia solani]
MPTPDERILAQIDRLQPACFSSERLRLKDYTHLLEIVLSAHPSLRKLNLDQCDDLIAEDPTIGLALRDAYASKSFSELVAHPSIIALSRSAQDTIMGSVPIAKSSSNGSSTLRAAFQANYQGDAHLYFIRVLNRSSQLPDLYNKSISIIQSSGMGKSRLVREAANEVFTIPANLREEPGEGIMAYPPPDRKLRSYFEDHESKSDELLQAEYAILLRCIFDTVKKEVSKDGQDDDKVGENRAKFYKDAVQEARNKIANISWGDFKGSKGSDQVELKPGFTLKNSNDLKGLFADTLSSARGLLEVLEPGYSELDGNVCFVPFDEAHSLTKPPQAIVGFRSRSPYHNLGTVLSKLCHLPIFFIFLSTNSHLRQFAPPASYHPSARVIKGSTLIAPFTQLPFDVFMTKMFEELDGSKRARSLFNACTTDVMSSMGRPLWFVHHKQWLEQTKSGQQNSEEQLEHVLQFAHQKLTARKVKERVPHSKLAALSVRIGVNFESTTHASREAESQQVESHMRVVYTIPEHWEYMRTGSSSEPVLAEAAANYLASGAGIAIMGPEILLENCQNDFLARGERGELCGRLLVTIAHDIAVKGTRIQMDKLLKDPRVKFHRPVPVLAFLRALFADMHHATVLQATPMADKAGKTLEDAFKDAYVCFSHFALAADSDMLDASALRMALFRGMAIQAKENQFSIDAVVPIHMGPITSPITMETTSAINLQFKNRKRSASCYVDRTVTVSDPNQPVISIVFELGEKLGRQLEGKKLKRLVEVHHQDSKSGSHQDNMHYSFVARGCRHETYKAVPEDTERSYHVILASGGLKDDVPMGDEESWPRIQELKPSFIAAKCQAEWDRWDHLDSKLSSIPLGFNGSPKKVVPPSDGKKRSKSADPGTSKAARWKRES